MPDKKLIRDVLNQVGKSLKLVEPAVSVAENVATAANVTGTIADNVSSASAAVGASSTGLSAAAGSVAAVGDTVKVIRDLVARYELHKDKSAIKEAIAVPEVKTALEQREHNTQVILLIETDVTRRENEVAQLEQTRARFEGTHDMTGPENVEAVAQLTQQIDQVRQGITAQQACAKMLDDQITEINQRPEMVALRPLESKVDLGKARAEDGITSIYRGLEMLRKYGSAVADAGATALTIASIAAPGANALSSTVPLAGGMVGMASGPLQIASSGASLVLNVSEYKEAKKAQQRAQDLRTEIDDPLLAAAMKRIEKKMQKDKWQSGASAGADALGVVGGFATTAAGATLFTTGVLGAVSAPIGGAAGAPTAVLTVAATATSVAVNAVATGAQLGVQAMKLQRHYSSVSAKNECIRAINGCQELERLGLMKMPSDDRGQPLRLQEGLVSKGQAKAILELQRHAMSKDVPNPDAKLDPTAAPFKKLLSADEALDPAKLLEYAKLRLVERDTREAVAVLASKLMEDCKPARDRREGAAIVESDLPVDSEAVKVARRLKMTDRQIANLVNTLENPDTQKLGLKTIAHKTGLRSADDKSLSKPRNVKQTPDSTQGRRMGL